MGLVDNGTQELESNVIEQSKADENLVQVPEGQTPTLDNKKMGCERLDIETATEEDVTGQNVENKLVSTEEISEIIKETGLNHVEISEDVGAEKGEPQLVNVEIMSVVENLEVASQNGLTSLENIHTLPGIASVNPGDGKLEPQQIDGTNESGQLNNEDRGSSGQSGKRKPKSKGPVTGSWSLRSKSQEKPKVPEPNDDVKEGTVSVEKKRRGRKKKQQQQPKKNTVNEFSKAKTHLRYLLHRIKYEQNLIDAYSAEGWKGQSLEKLKPEKELQRARSHILRYKMKIRALFQRLDTSLAVGKLPESLFDSLGEIDCEDIFCAKCGSKDLTLDNDIILCDGACERGFHQFCLEPPLLKEDIPPGDEGWLCPGCDCKVDCIEMLKDFQGTKISITDNWEKIFPEAAAASSGRTVDDGFGNLSDDSEDDDYDPDKHNTPDKVEGDKSSSDESDYFSAPDDLAAPLNNDKYLGLPSDDSEDDDFDPSAPDQDEDEDKQLEDGSSSDFTSDSEDLGALLEDDIGIDKDLGQTPPSPDFGQPSTGFKVENSRVGRTKRQSIKDELSCLMETNVEPISGKRHVERLDYKQLHDATFGNSSSDSSDEDFNDTTSCDETTNRKRRKTDDDATSRKMRKAHRAKTQLKSPEDENQEESKHVPRRGRKKDADGAASGSLAKAGSASSGTKRSAHKRLREATTQRLYASFNENQYPEKAVKENLAEELGITVRQVSKWFENARWSYNHRNQMESNATEKSPEPQPTKGNNPSNQNMELQASAQDHNAEAREENLVSNKAKKILKII